MSFLPWGGRPSCPAHSDEKKLVEDGFLYLAERIGLDRLRKTTVIEPTPQFFPDRYDASMEAAEQMFARVCGYMGIKPASVGLGFLQGEEGSHVVEMTGDFGSHRTTKGAAGYYTQSDGVDQVWLKEEELADPEALVATMAHELAHVVLMGRSAMSHDEPHLEAITDLATIYLGLGIFTSNRLLRRTGWVEGNLEYWQLQRKGYISPEMAGWALTLFAFARGESDPKWAKHLGADGKGYLKQGLRYLQKTGDQSFLTA
jgi:hypothetical protein